MEKVIDIHLSVPVVGNKELKWIRKALDTGWITTQGPCINLFAKELSLMHENQEVLLTNSGTSALHLALLSIGIKPNDIVLVTSFSFVATLNPIFYVGAIPVFVDVCLRSGNMSAELLEEAIKKTLKYYKKTPKALIAADIYGVVANWPSIKKICKQYEIITIEDAAEALGSRYNKRLAGCWGDLSVFSFNGNKIITTSSGGALLSKKKKWIQKASYYAMQAKEKGAYYHKTVGYNYTMSNILASIGIAQLKKLNKKIKKRQKVLNRYKQALSKHVSFFKPDENTESNAWLSNILTADETTLLKIIAALRDRSVESRRLWYPLNEFPNSKKFLSIDKGNAKKLYKTGLSLPSTENLPKKKQDEICDVVLNHVK